MGCLFVALAVYWDDIVFQYNKVYWRPTSSLDGLTLGMSKSDLIFLKGEPTCSEVSNTCFWGNPDYDDILAVGIQDEIVTSVTKQRPYGYSPPFTNVEELKEILGEEDILAVSKDYLTRRYTYLKWGITFNFEQNRLVSAMVGQIEWRSIPGGEYKIRGVRICPGERCPWSDDEQLKPEYQGKDYSIFLD
jgi:hypothetical protein